MAKKQHKEITDGLRPLRPGLTPESQENHMIALAVNLAEKQLREGTASSQVITHYLKLGTTKMQLEKEILEEQKKLVKAKTEALESNRKLEEMYTNAMEAMRKYKGSIENDDDTDIQ